jgi:hypothetical protein
MGWHCDRISIVTLREIVEEAKLPSRHYARVCQVTLPTIA